MAFLSLTGVNAQTIAGFTVSSVSGCSPHTVQFTNTSLGTISSYYWDLGNGKFSTLKDPATIYTSAGKYSITLIVTDNAGNKDTLKKIDFIEIFDNPVADFQSNSTKGCLPFKTTFTDNSAIGSGKITSWLWDFGDGNTSTSQNPTHTYTTGGRFDVKLRVTDQNGCKSLVVKNSYIQAYNRPAITLTAKDTTACAEPFTVDFKGNAQGASTYSYAWDFGDGNTSSLQNPSHTYAQKGLFTVKLTVTDQYGCSYTITKNSFIFVGNEVPDFRNSTSGGCPALQVNFTNKTTPARPGTQYIWDFGDSTFSNHPNPTHTYTKGGTYTVTLKAISVAGCQSVVIKKKLISVYNLPQVKMEASDTQMCNGRYFISFTNKTINSTVVRWDFGDGGSSNDEDPVHEYKKPGKYSVVLTVASSQGCRQTLRKTNYIVLYNGAARMEPSQTEGCAPLTVNFNNNSFSTDSVISWNWDYGDGTSSKLKEGLTKVYKDSGYYYTSLQLTTLNGCSYVTHHRIKVGIKPKAGFTADKLVGCIMDMPVNFTNFHDTFNIPADSFLWSFGDGNSSIAEDAVHYYDAPPGKYTVTLRVYNKGCVDSFQRKDYIEILPPYAMFSKKYEMCGVNKVTFTDMSVGGDSILWIIDGIDSTTEKNPERVFAQAGIHWIT
ncbi:MAG: PKD domain-containing protein, partial [Bacteroidota bacterium]|nr:PKD domain-containing protein [Bacteroidota bacterium]